MPCAVDYCQPANWASAGLAGMCAPVLVDADAVFGSAGAWLGAEPYLVRDAEVRLGAGSGGSGQAAVEVVACGDDAPFRVEPFCLQVQASGAALADVGFAGYGLVEARVDLGGSGRMRVDAEVMLQPFGCDWMCAPVVVDADAVVATCTFTAEGMGSATFLAGDEVLLPCDCLSLAPVCPTGVGWHGVSAAVVQVNKAETIYYGQSLGRVAGTLQAVPYVQQWARGGAAAGALLSVDARALDWVAVLAGGSSAARLGVTGWQVQFVQAGAAAAAQLSVSGWTVQWLDVALGGVAAGVAADAVDDSEAVVTVRVPRYQARHYAPVQAVTVNAGDVVYLAVDDGQRVTDMVQAWLVAGDALFSYTRDTLVLREAVPGLVALKVLRVSGQIIDVKVLVS